jgi:hypothetical protein
VPLLIPTRQHRLAIENTIVSCICPETAPPLPLVSDPQEISRACVGASDTGLLHKSSIGDYAGITATISSVTGSTIRMLSPTRM